MTRIERLNANPDRAGRYHVCFDDGTSMRLYRQTVEDFGLFTGMELSPEEMSDLREAASRMSAKMRAIRIVSAASVSKGDLEHRLIQKGEDPNYAKDAVSWMTDLNLLDDRKTAEQLVYRCISKGYGKARAKQVLFEKRIPKDLWDEVLDDYPVQTDAIKNFISAHLGNQPTDKEIKKVIDALLRRGHSWSSIRQALNECVQDADNFREE